MKNVKLNPMILIFSRVLNIVILLVTMELEHYFYFLSIYFGFKIKMLLIFFNIILQWLYVSKDFLESFLSCKYI